MNRSGIALALLLSVSLAAPVRSQDDDSIEAYRRTVAATAGMVGDPTAQALAARHGLQILNVTWEDTGRYKGSSVGPNISDMTIQVHEKDPRPGSRRLTCMPVIRFPNFEDRTADLPIDDFTLLVGNEEGGPIRKVTLREFLGRPREYLDDPSSWKGPWTSLLAERDTHVLVSAQACFLPIPRGAEATFNPVLFNYQSRPGDPAVLTILCTREGTSVTVIDNVRDGFGEGGAWGQRLFFNQDGQRASLTGRRESDFVAGRADAGVADATPAAGEEGGLNLVLLIQVPLKQKPPRPRPAPSFFDGAECAPQFEMAAPSSDVERAVIGHGELEGPFTEFGGLDVQRDARFPIRVTVQFYQATSNGVVSEVDMARFASQIARVYEQADFVGSLVTAGHTGRPTEYDGDKIEPPGWWHDFWTRHERETGLSLPDTIALIREVHGPRWSPGDDEDDLEDAIEEALGCYESRYPDRCLAPPSGTAMATLTGWLPDGPEGSLLAAASILALGLTILFVLRRRRAVRRI